MATAKIFRSLLILQVKSIGGWWGWYSSFLRTMTKKSECSEAWKPHPFVTFQAIVKMSPWSSHLTTSLRRVVRELLDSRDTYQAVNYSRKMQRFSQLDLKWKVILFLFFFLPPKGKENWRFFCCNDTQKRFYLIKANGFARCHARREFIGFFFLVC